MNQSDPDDLEWLRTGLRAADRPSDDGEHTDALDPEVLWRAYQGELPAARAVEVIDSAARSPGGHEELALLVALDDEFGAPRRSSGVANRGWVIAAVAVAAAVLVWVLRPMGPGSEIELGDPEYRSGQPDVLRSLVAPDTPLPADAFELRWEGVSGACTYRIRASNAELKLVFERGGLVEPRVRIPANALAGVPSGAVILWQTEVRCDDGRTGRSSTHRARVE